ncbi:Ubiquinone/menaquinone biosynthesis C-methyltransferase UbiE [bioreactor metagenome]|uniref:Ubiquinone/menaquinone biosynthesis C-methyltransferase UbiE n=1 Tax=bioreactor metagenome TaxID=1076179 RepID=A0A644YTP2_9ZZZZ|nr:class I SAM-dependent methyltransferase [Oscillospiraceae bacterium]
MNTIWSTYLQRAGTLYYTRSLRFSDIFKESYAKSFNIDFVKNILEIGCGPGALSQSLYRWYPNAEILGTDRDSQFVKFSAKHAPYIKFLEADATKLPFGDNSFDVTISNTVQEHVEPSKFFGEQYRVLKPNGVCLVLSARRGINIQAPCIAEQTEFETEIYNRTKNFYSETDKKYNVCAYPLSESELPLAMQKFGFMNVSTNYLTINLTPDNPQYSKEIAYAMINANRQVELDSIEYLPHIAPNVVTADEIERLKEVKNTKYDKRLALYDAGEKQWDTNMSLTMILRGTK